MLPLLPILLLALCIGAGDTSNSISTLVGSRILTFRRAVLISIAFLMLGLLAEGWKIEGTVAKELVSGENRFLRELPEASISICLATFVSSFPFLLLGFPVSTTQPLLASLIGAGIVMGENFKVQTRKFAALVTCWTLAPVFSFFLSFLLSRLMSRIFRTFKNLLGLHRTLAISLLFCSAYVAYTNGANDGGTLLGIASPLDSGLIFTLLLGLTISAGSLLSREVVRTIGTGLAKLDPFTALTAQLAAALSVWSFVQLHFPVSLTQALTGSVIGVGLSKGATTILSRMKKILIVWILCPLLSFGLSALFSLPLSP